jgi:hypothetical protein
MTDTGATDGYRTVSSAALDLQEKSQELFQ